MSAMVNFGSPVIIAGSYDKNSLKTSEKFEVGKGDMFTVERNTIHNIPVNDEWEKFNGLTALVVNEKIFTFGGSCGENCFVSYSYVFDKNKWTKMDGLKKPKMLHSSVTHGKYIYHAGGCKNCIAKTPIDYDTIERWTIKDDEFTKELFNLNYTQFSLIRPVIFEIKNGNCNT